MMKSTVLMVERLAVVLTASNGCGLCLSQVSRLEIH